MDSNESESKTDSNNNEKQKDLPQISIANTDTDEKPTVITFNSGSLVSFGGVSVLGESKPGCSQSSTNIVKDNSNKSSGILNNTDVVNAVEIRSVTFGYSKTASILTNVNIKVPKGKIYALLGSSGCGKTTLLRIILGRLKPRKGKVQVLGEQPGTKYSSIPGPGVGYMPQELALFTEFTIEETLLYFGSLYHMNRQRIEQRIQFLVELLNLPNRDKKVSQCSGGQQRRVSIAATLFHSPPLLILDEPTVGVDPLLRCKIWEYLENICENEGKTVIITTHYIEESRTATTIAFLRFGRVLTQSSPDLLLRKYKCEALEDVFLQLCQADCGEIKKRTTIKRLHPELLKKKEEEPVYDEQGNELVVKKKFKQTAFDGRRFMALFHKNYLKLKGNPALVFFFLILPVIQVTLLCESVAKQPDHLPIAIYNPETNGNLSTAFLDLLDSRMVKQIYKPSLEEAIDLVIKGKAWYTITMSQNFSEAYSARAENPSELYDEDVENSKIKLYADHSDSFIQQYLYQSILDSYQAFIENYVSSIGYNPATVSLPLKIETPIYGEVKHSLINTLAPGAMVAIIYSTPLLLASFLIVLERKDGLLERSFVAGVRSFEILISHIVILLIALFIQVALLMFVAFFLFGVELKGPLAETFSLMFLQGLQGITFGLLVSALANNEIMALMSAFGLVFPVWMTCGVFWPLDAVPNILKQIFYVFPLSYPIESMRYVISRGWTIFYWDVQLGFLVSGLYNIVLFSSTIILFHFTSS